MYDMFGNADIESALQKISKIPFGGYTGNKRRVLKNLWMALEDEGIEFNSVFDAFSGSSVFSLFMKFMGKEVIANDFLTSSYLNALALVENPGYRLTFEEMMFVVNNQPKYDVKDGFIYKNYKDIRFTEKECIDLDRFRINLSLLGNSDVSPTLGNDRGVGMYRHRIEGMNRDIPQIPHLFSDNQRASFDAWFSRYNSMTSESVIHSDDKRIRMAKAFLLRNMESNILKNCFLGGRYNNGQVIANLDHRINHKNHNGAENIDFIKELLVDYFNPKYDILEGSYKPCVSLNCDIIELLENSDFVTDVIYLDPPYGGASTDYAYLYQFLEEYIYGEKMDEIDHIQNYGKRFVSKKTYEEHFLKMLELIDRFPIWMLSYNDSSWESKERIIELLSKFRNNVTVHEVNNYIYKYRSDKTDKTGVEYIFIAKK